MDNKNSKEYLISEDTNKVVMVWDIGEKYSIKYKINTRYGDRNYIFSCLLAFPHNNNHNYIITSCCISTGNYEKSSTRIYSMETGEFIKNIEGTDSMSVLYLLSWYNKLNKNYYIIQLGDGFVSINDLQNNDIYFKIEIGKSLHIFYAGLIYSLNDKDYLCTLMEQGMVSIINLYDKQTIKNI